jgi:hypothetical protein
VTRERLLLPNKNIELAANRVLPGKTTVIYLGDNIYPKGIGLPGSKTEESTKDVLRSQYQPMRTRGAAVYFVPGNHDWDRSGPKGLARIRYQGEFLREQNDSALRLVPSGGCPDPVEIQLTPLLTVIAFDSEWWLFPYNKTSPGGDCECKTRSDVAAKLLELRYRNRNRIILMASHHPFKTYGQHGGVMTWKEHLFPLRAINSNYYIPLPIIGSLYPLLRTTFSDPQDVKHPLYRHMISRVGGVFEGNPNVAFVAGHEHGLQMIKEKRLQIVSGSGAKHAHVKKGRYSLFAAETPGYVTADLLSDNNLRFGFYINSDSAEELAFRYTLPYTPFDEQEALAAKVITADSLSISIRPSYDQKGKIHRLLFGENYRKEWAAPTMLPVLRISEISGGLKPLQLGGGMQSKSLRLADSRGKEWVIRSVEKSPDALLPEALRETFARDWLDDVTSAQHPFSALVVPPIAEAVKVPHARPVIGVLSPDKNLGIYGRNFNNLVVLLEEREPLGDTDNSEKFKNNLQKDNDNVLNGKAFLRARMLDALLGDWDRHEDQWRWYDTEKGKEKVYVGVPRDRDQVFHLTQGLFPFIASRPAILPTLRNFGPKPDKVKWLLFKTRFVDAYPSMQLSREEWKKQADAFTAAVTDSVLQTAIRRLPGSSFDIRGGLLLQKLQSRRENLQKAMDRYYTFSQKIVDIRASDKNEWVQVTDAPNKGLSLRMFKISKEGDVKEALMQKAYDAALTREIRIYLGDGKDSVTIDNQASNIKLRIIGGDDPKFYHVSAAGRKIRLYDKQNGATFSGNTSRLVKKISDDSLNTAYSAVNLYNIFMPVFSMGLNRDDGFIFGAGFRYIMQEGFRKAPYASMHQFLASHSFSTSAYRVRYNGEWIKTFGRADFTLFALARAPFNTINFFGRGNETPFNKSGDYIRFYRTRFSTYQLEPAVRWRGPKGSALSIGPSLYYYGYEADDNFGRFITNPGTIGSYDSLTIDKKKMHLGVALQYVNDKRNSKVITQWGSFVRIHVQAYKGVGIYAATTPRSFPR